MKRIHVVDTTLRDGSHAVSHSYSIDQVKAVAAGLDACNLEFIELSHGDGISGSSYNYGFSEVEELDLLEAANSVIHNAKLTVLLIPGIGTVEDLKAAQARGATAVRVATHVTEADISQQHIVAAKEMGMFTVGFLMMVHMSEPERIVEQAKLMESYGADYLNIADSAGFMMPDDVKRRIEALVDALEIPIGFHAHNNLGMAIANSLAAVQSGATYIDATLRGLGAGAGNTQLEVFQGVVQRAGFDTGLDFYGLMDLAENVLEPMMHRSQTIGTGSTMLGYAGVYSSFLLHVFNAGIKFGIDPRDILVELGHRNMVGGQEDMIIDVAYQLTQKKSAERY
ncbi:MAG: 4-hydroxy-2-oxovalerate aldolase [Coriobacteriia bacterium]|nr:4-hydroxy-2-oxovalerate aldolase [Coriobacteriia bacterium]